MDRLKVASGKPMRMMALVLGLGLVSGCEEGAGPGFLQSKDSPEQVSTKPGQSTKLVERDVEAPDVFQVTEAGLWDGRPSLGGVWVAHPDVKDPQRVIIRNQANGKFVIGALFRREREIPGPRVQASSDAAAALGMLAGAPVELNVTALVREAIPDPVEAAQPDDATVEPDSKIDPDNKIEETTLDPIAGAAAAIDAAAPSATALSASAPVNSGTVVAAAATPKTSSLGKPYIQIGIFNIKANANRTADQLRSEGMVPTVFEQSGSGKPFWRVVVGPAQSKSERSALLKTVKAAGFSDAYVVSN